LLQRLKLVVVHKQALDWMPAEWSVICFAFINSPQRKQFIGQGGGHRDYATWFPPLTVYPSRRWLDFRYSRFEIPLTNNSISRREENEN
jgi:hypothetical protein